MWQLLRIISCQDPIKSSCSELVLCPLATCRCSTKMCTSFSKAPDRGAFAPDSFSIRPIEPQKASSLKLPLASQALPESAPAQLAPSPPPRSRPGAALALPGSRPCSSPPGPTRPGPRSDACEWKRPPMCCISNATTCAGKTSREESTSRPKAWREVVRPQRPPASLGPAGSPRPPRPRWLGRAGRCSA